MNIVSIVKDLMNLKIITKSTIMTQEMLRQLKNHEEKLIDIDSDKVILKR